MNRTALQILVGGDTLLCQSGEKEFFSRLLIFASLGRFWVGFNKFQLLTHYYRPLLAEYVYNVDLMWEAWRDFGLTSKALTVGFLSNFLLLQ